MIILMTAPAVNNMIESIGIAGVVKAWNVGVGSFIPIPRTLITPPNLSPTIPSNAKQGIDVPKNLIIVPLCTGSCPVIVGTGKDSIIDATAVTNAVIFTVGGNNVVECGSGTCKVYGGTGNDFIIGEASNAQEYAGKGNDILVGGSGPSVLVGGSGNDQFFSGPAGDLMVGGPGTNYFDCGTAGNGIIVNFNPAHGDTKATNCKYVIPKKGTPAVPP